MAAAVKYDAPTYPQLRRAVAKMAFERGEWAGMPVPVEGLSLHVEPSYPYADFLSKKVPDPNEPQRENPLGLDENGLLPGETLVNSWYSHARQAHVFLVRTAEGRAQHFVLPEYRYTRRLTIGLKAYQAMWAHDLEAEAAALATLAAHTTAEQMRQYALLGEFLETSKRSGVTYIFRRVRPTVALRPTINGESMKCIAVLCMHPIAYYRETTVGAMTPTDDVLAHLLLMRGDEKMFWRRSNQHQPEDPEAML